MAESGVPGESGPTVVHSLDDVRRRAQEARQRGERLPRRGNTSGPGTVITNLEEIKRKVEEGKPVDLPEEEAKEGGTFNEFGEIVEKKPQGG